MPLPSSVARALQQHTEQFAPIPVTLPWDDPTPTETPVEAEHRRPRTYAGARGSAAIDAIFA
ncbi:MULTISPECIES: hypothetical protein [unclassified Streptomyces]|uniref:hypothetical protein n=1 Tax=unclassified Streptomyces TaxID=2593676 RepID=UPI0008515E27|nr:MULTISPECIES: hypothetical protein [unclassified Streptomyces]